MDLVRKVAAVAATAGAMVALGAGAASADTAPASDKCPPGFLYHPYEGCIPIPPGPNG